MNAEKDEARERVIDQVLNASTLPEINAARQTLRDWLTAYPEETGMRDGFEQLSLMEDAAREDDQESCVPVPASAQVA